MDKVKLLNREISWLSFNYRVLQEAKDPSVPLLERLKFLAIYSSNLNEFFSVRIASLRSLIKLNKETLDELKFDPSKLLKQIHNIILDHQNEFGKIYRKQILPELAQNNIYLLDNDQLNTTQKSFIDEYFDSYVQQYIQPILLVKNKINPFLQNGKLYLAVKLKGKSSKKVKNARHRYAILKIPTDHLPRFVKIPEKNKSTIVYLDDIIRNNLSKTFPGYDVIDSYSIKMSRDAELYITDEFSGNLLEKLRKSLTKRNIGAPIRVLYDSKMPKNMLEFLKAALNLRKEDLVEGAKYHNFSDFFDFPQSENKSLYYQEYKPLRINEIDKSENIFKLIKKKDILIHFPYQTYNHVIEFLEAAAEDKNTTCIKITQYRVAKNSAVIKSLKKAVQNGKRVIVFVEVKARFDEESNFQWAAEMESSGIKVLYSFPGLKVHSKLALVTRIENDEIKNYCYLATGNFNEKTARVYTDFGLLTANPEITDEADKVFDHLEGRLKKYKFNTLLVGQFNMRKRFNQLIDNEIELANESKKAEITIKINNLEDKKIIKRLYEASQAGVKINLLVRGICCLVPNKKGLSENIKVYSIVDRFLEHSRVFIFHNGGNELIFAGSADWMKRNLSRRIEVVFPIIDPNLKREIKNIIGIQFSDNLKTRIIDEAASNKYKSDGSKQKVRSQEAIYNYYLKKPKK